MPVLEEGSSSSSPIAEHMKLRRPRNQITEADTTSEIPSVIQSTRCKSTISSLFLSTFSAGNNGANETVPTNTNVTPKKKATQSTFRGLGCTASASQQVSVPAVIRTSADWEAKKLKKKIQKQEKKKKGGNTNSSIKIGNENSNVHEDFISDGGNGNGSGAIQDVCCSPGIGFSADAVGSVDCVVARRNVPGRGKIDGRRISHRERRTVTPEAFSFLDSDSGFASSHPEQDFFATRYRRHARHPSPEGLAEIFYLQNSLLMGGRSESRDQFGAWRLDIDDMTYEQLLELSDRIGYVNTGLKEDEISKCLRKIEHTLLNDLPSNVSVQVDGKCSICQEEYEADDEMGKLYCGHRFHIQCIKQWLTQKKTCPVCKTEATT